MAVSLWKEHLTASMAGTVSLLPLVFQLSACTASHVAAPSSAPGSATEPRDSHSQPEPVKGAPRGTLTSEMGSSKEPTTEAVTMAHLLETARSLPANAVAQRIAVGDVAYPRTQEENEAMGGFALLLVTAVAQDPAELPLKRVTLATNGKEVALLRAAGKPSIVTNKEVRRAFGIARVDELYYLPVFGTRIRAIVSVDFAANRENLELLRFPPPQDQDALPREFKVIRDVREPDAAVAERLAEEEFQWSTRGTP